MRFLNNLEYLGMIPRYVFDKNCLHYSHQIRRLIHIVLYIALRVNLSLMYRPSYPFQIILNWVSCETVASEEIWVDWIWSYSFSNTKHCITIKHKKMCTGFGLFFLLLIFLSKEYLGHSKRPRKVSMLYINIKIIICQFYL